LGAPIDRVTPDRCLQRNQILAGHGRVEAAKSLGMSEVPTVRLSQMTEADRRAYVIADNKLALNAGWDSEVLAGEMQALIEIGFDIELTGFSLPRST
jgi:ParB-like chromosome segregation protein Spo0J